MGPDQVADLQMRHEGTSAFGQVQTSSLRNLLRASGREHIFVKVASPTSDYCDLHVVWTPGRELGWATQTVAAEEHAWRTH
eukprot:2508470-Amphidinium_carterae.1